MTQYGETYKFSASQHIKAIHETVGEEFIDAAIINTTLPPHELIEKYMRENSQPVTADVPEIVDMGITVYAKDLIEAGDYVRHNPEKLTAVLLEVMEKARV